MTKTYDIVGAPHEIYLQVKNNPTAWAVITEMTRRYDKRISSVQITEKILAEEFEMTIPPIKNAINHLITLGIIIRTYKGHSGVGSKFNIPLLDQYFISKGLKNPPKNFQTTTKTPVWKDAVTTEFIQAWEGKTGKQVTQFSKDLQTRLDTLLVTTSPKTYLDWYFAEVEKHGWIVQGIAHSLADGVVKRFFKASTEKEEIETTVDNVFSPIEFPEVLTKENFDAAWKKFDAELKTREWFADYRQGVIDRSKGLGIIKNNFFNGTTSIMEFLGSWENGEWSPRNDLSEQEWKICDFIDSYVKSVTERC